MFGAVSGESCLEQMAVPVYGALSSLSQSAGALGVLTCCLLPQGDFSLWCCHLGDEH